MKKWKHSKLITNYHSFKCASSCPHNKFLRHANFPQHWYEVHIKIIHTVPYLALCVHVTFPKNKKAFYDIFQIEVLPNVCGIRPRGTTER